MWGLCKLWGYESGLWVPGSWFSWLFRFRIADELNREWRGGGGGFASFGFRIGFLCGLSARFIDYRLFLQRWIRAIVWCTLSGNEAKCQPATANLWKRRRIHDRKPHGIAKGVIGFLGSNSIKVSNQNLANLQKIFFAKNAVFYVNQISIISQRAA